MDSTSRFDVLVCGSLHLDVMVHAPGLPRLDETAVGTSWAFKCGGKGGNQAVMASRLGSRVAMVGRVGTDDFGRALLSNLERAGVDRSAVVVDPAPGSGMSVAIVTPEGDYGAVIVSGSNLSIEPGVAAEAWASLGGARVLVLQNEVPEAVNMAAAVAARSAGATVVLNAAPTKALSPALLKTIDVLVVNRIEAEFLCGGPVSEPEEAASVLDSSTHHEMGIVITLGGEGLVVRARGESPRKVAPHRVKVASSHGAGDCFVGAMAARLARGHSLSAACDWANAAAALYVSCAGPELASTVCAEGVDGFLQGRATASG